MRASTGKAVIDNAAPMKRLKLVKPTLPVGLLPVTVAVKVMLEPTVAGLAELVTVVVVKLLQK